MIKQDYIELFQSLHPGFFEKDGIRDMPEEYVFDEMILPLGEFDPRKYGKWLGDNISFGFFEDNLKDLQAAVEKVDEDWPQYFKETTRVYCGYLDGKIASFCTVDDLGLHSAGGQVIKVGGPGCVGTLPEYRDKGIGLTMVKRVTQILKDEGFDYSYIHYTYVADWYKKLGYKTVLQWNRNGVL
ncbi:MAG: GNAT family N-acetyltransferase [Acutalibacter sp.]|nr:GNAT family N-acetyltransferase [Acutalibacter sp.]